METKQKKEKSEINLLAGKASFTNEPLWYRLIVIVLLAAFLLVVFWVFYRLDKFIISVLVS